jgi:hypothetical protein
MLVWCVYTSELHIFEATISFTTLGHERNADTGRLNATHMVEGILEYQQIWKMFGKNGIALHSRTGILPLSNFY